MQVALIGASGRIGRRAVPALLDASYDVVAGVRRPHEAARVPTGSDGRAARTVVCDVLDPDSLLDLVHGCDAVVDLASHEPDHWQIAVPGSWRRQDQLLTRGVENLVAAAYLADVRRVVLQSSSVLYADGGEGWVREGHPVDVTSATEPLAVAESQVLDLAGPTRAAVVLRLGHVVGGGETHPVGLGIGSPESWMHLVHPDDAAEAVVAALRAPTGTYNVGAEPLRRSEVETGVLGRPGLLTRRLGAGRLEPHARSLRVSSDHFTATTGWAPWHQRWSPEWLGAWESHQARS
ncbi:NAD-dependent epimerase/dehydratase family protein [Marmoricola endophyticus]|nr:NAD(P)-dependent oxidoreductase [Marmoricola endophyticus]